MYDAQEKKYAQLCFHGKKAFEPLFQIPTTSTPYQIVSLDESGLKNLLHVKIDEDWMVFLFHTAHADIEFIKAILESFEEKLANAIHGCKSHLEIIEMNQKLERLIEEEVAKKQRKR